MSKTKGILAILLVMSSTGWALQYYTTFSAEDMDALRRAIIEHGSPLNLPTEMTADFDHLCVEVRQTSDHKAPPKEPTADDAAIAEHMEQTP